MNKTLEKILAPVIVASALAVNPAKADAVIVDPLTMLQTSYNYSQAIQNPHPTWGNIKGIDTFDNGNKVVAVWDSGMGATYTSDLSQELAQFDFHASGATGIMVVPNYGLTDTFFVVSDNNTFGYYDASGNFKGGKTIQSSSITDPTYNPVLKQGIVSTHFDATKLVNDDGSLSAFTPSNPNAVKYLHMGKDDNGNEIDDLFQSESAFYRVDKTTGRLATDVLPLLTNLGLGMDVQGAAWTRNGPIIAVDQGFLKYDIPEIGSRILFAFLGDLNCDGSVDVNDIAAFVLALTDDAAYQSTFPGCEISRADLNGDNAVNGLDIQPFVSTLLGL